MMDRKPQATTMPMASSAPRLCRESRARLATSHSSPIVQLAARWPTATGSVTTAANGAPPISTMLARRKR
jgi:hypothetical protein